MTQKIISNASERPLSPHLQIYRPQMSSVTSILHRITGVALSVGTILLVLWLWAAAYSPECFASIHHFLTGTFGMLILFGWTGAFYYHLCNGIRHLFWDVGYGFTLDVATKSGWAVFASATFLTLVTWVIALTSHVGVEP